MTRTLTAAALLALAACNGKDDDHDSGAHDTQTDPAGTGGGTVVTGTGATGGGTGGGTATGGPVGDEPWLQGTVTVDDGSTFVFVADQVYGGHNDQDWGFSALGTDITNSLSVSFDGSMGTGTWDVGTPEEAVNFGAYVDMGFGMIGSGFTSTDGTVEITRHVQVADLQEEIDGVFSIGFVNYDNVALTIDGSFYNVPMFGE